MKFQDLCKSVQKAVTKQAERNGQTADRFLDLVEKAEQIEAESVYQSALDIDCCDWDNMPTKSYRLK
jgi:hypothetical protein